MIELKLPARKEKPREQGLNILIDNGYPLHYFTDIVSSMFKQIDFIKFGWGTSLVSGNLQEKINILNDYEIKYFFGGTLFEKFLYQNKIFEYKEFLHRYKCEYMEVSNGTIDISNQEKCKYISDFAKEFKVLSEVGLKDSEKSEEMPPKKWIEYILADLKAGAYKVITESRESGTSGICRSNGDVRVGLLEEIIDSEIDLEKIIFEAPNKKLQIHLIKKLGTNCNLANISFGDVIGLETLRLGLRSDTFFRFENDNKDK